MKRCPVDHRQAINVHRTEFDDSGMLLVLTVLVHLAPTVVARSTLFTMIGWTGGWGAAALTVALLPWAVVRRTCVGVLGSGRSRGQVRDLPGGVDQGSQEELHCYA